jgi:hypothetical protein
MMTDGTQTGEDRSRTAGCSRGAGDGDRQMYKSAVPLARALVAGGLPVLEITLRTVKALDCDPCHHSLKSKGAIVGAGTVLSVQQLRDRSKSSVVQVCRVAGVFDRKAASGRGRTYDIAAAAGGHHRVRSA